jgi:hypothetical protein
LLERWSLVTKRVQKRTAAKLRSWRVIIMRRKGEYLGSVEAPDLKTSLLCFSAPQSRD